MRIRQETACPQGAVVCFVSKAFGSRICAAPVVQAGVKIYHYRVPRQAATAERSWPRFQELTQSQQDVRRYAKCTSSTLMLSSFVATRAVASAPVSVILRPLIQETYQLVVSDATEFQLLSS